MKSGASGAPRSAWPWAGTRVLLGTRVRALTCRFETSPLMHGDILSSYVCFPKGTWMRPLSISSSATAGGEESPESPKAPLSSWGGDSPGTDTEAGTAQPQLTCTSSLRRDRRARARSTFPAPHRHSSICSQDTTCAQPLPTHLRYLQRSAPPGQSCPGAPCSPPHHPHSLSC